MASLYFLSFCEKQKTLHITLATIGYFLLGPFFNLQPKLEFVQLLTIIDII